MRGKVSEERNLLPGFVQIQTPNLYDLSFNSLSLAISSPILRRLLSFSRFPRANVSIFPVLASWYNTLDNTFVRSIDGKSLLVNRTETERKSGRLQKSIRIVLMRPRLRQFSIEFSNRFEFSSKNSFRFLTWRKMLEKSVRRRGKSFERIK